MQKKLVKAKMKKKKARPGRSFKDSTISFSGTYETPKPFSVTIECPYDNPAEPDADRGEDLLEAALAVQQAIGLGLRPTITHQVDPVQKVCEGGYQVQKGKEVITIIFEKKEEA